MRIVVAPNAFKESLTAIEAADSITRGIRRVLPAAEIIVVPVADGGTGTVEALVSATAGRVVTVPVTGPLGEPVEAVFGVLGDGRTAVIEMASASGIDLVPRDKRNPMITTTRGTGELILSALDEGAEVVIVGAGNSATVDGGAGMAGALGISFLDSEGSEIPPGGGGLCCLERIDISGIDERIGRTEVIGACDVENPLTGEEGAARVYAPQKGATDDMVAELEDNLKRFAGIVKRDLGVDVEGLAGAGAAGGLGAALVAFLDGRLMRGVDIVLEYSGLREKMAGADLVITGEGRLDGQTVFGKAPIGVARLARECGVRTIAFAGSIGDGAEAVLGEGIEAYFPILPYPMGLDEALRKASEFLQAAVAQAIRHLKLGYS